MASPKKTQNLVVQASSVSCPRHADSPSSGTSISTFSSVDSDMEVREALRFMRKFLQSNSQDPSEKSKFLDCVDRVTTNFSESKMGFMVQHYNLSVIRDTLKYLLPETSSPDAQEREKTLCRITKLITYITGYCTHKGTKDLKFGQLAGCLTLCCCDPSESICHWAAEGLHRLYNMLINQKGVSKEENKEDSRELQQEQEEEKVFWLAWFSNAVTATTVFKKHLRPDEQIDFILTAIKGMRDDSIHNTKAAVSMLNTMIKDPSFTFVKVPKAIKSIYSNLDYISDVQGRLAVFRYLVILADRHPEEVTSVLLDCSLLCDDAASIMWDTLTCSPETSQKILMVLQSSLQEQPLYRDRFGMKARLSPLAATSAIYEILKHLSPVSREVLKKMYPTLSIALLCQISHTVNFSPQDVGIFWRACKQQQIPTPPAPLRSALRTFKLLVKRSSEGDDSLLMNKRRGSELLSHPTTHHKGLSLFARSLVRNNDCEMLLPFLMDILSSKEDITHITAMIFVVEILRQKTLSSAMLDLIISQFHVQLKASRADIRSLALDGVLLMVNEPGKREKLSALFPLILNKLRETNREVNVKALKILPELLESMPTQEVNLHAVEVANSTLPLFDDASNKVRHAAISTYCRLLDLIRRGGRDRMKELALQSLVPLMVHLQDESNLVTQTCWFALKKTDCFLKSFIQAPIQDAETWKFCKCLIKRYQDSGEEIFVQQAYFYLENPRLSLREGAVMILEILIEETKNEEMASSIAAVLRYVDVTAKPSNICLVASQARSSLHRGSGAENVFGRCFNRMKTICRR